MIRRQFYSICVLVGLLIFSAATQAAPQIPVPWQCSFEENEDLSDWVLNPGTTAAQDQWTIGTATRSDGKRSLYISTNQGQMAMAGAKQNIVMAYRKIHFPEHTSGTKMYDISFDWKAMGNGTLYVYFGYYSKLITGTDNILQYANSTSSVGLTKEMLGQAQWVCATDYTRRTTMEQEQRWRNVSIDAGGNTTYSVSLSAKNSRTDYALVFVWVNKNQNPDEIDMGACIDNIQIASALYEKPKDLQAIMQCEDSSFLIKWTGNVSDYSVEIRRNNQSTWRRYTHQATAPSFQFTIPGLKEGLYDFRVRGWKGNDTTAYTVLNGKTLLCLENHCINYVDLDHADCTYGQYASSNIDPFQYQGRIDYGAEEIGSFHTVYADVDEYDIRTNYKLKTVPDNEFASVRLGTWLCPSSNKFTLADGSSVNIGGYSVTYDLTVDTATQALLLLKYAIVMEQAHDGNERAYFRLEILDENGYVLDADCGAKEFYCPADSMAAVNEGWTIYSSKTFPFKNKDVGLNGNNIYWKDWTTMGINLTEQSGVKHGDRLKVRIIARGCTVGGHYCYGYFTLNCASASIETDQCSGNPTVVAEAPEGFSYTWYAEKNRDLFEQGVGTDADGEKVVRGRDPELNVVAGDTNVYVCRLSDLTEPSCYFELKTRLSPRSPMPMFKHKQMANNCQNIIQFKDSARVADYGADGKLHISAEACEYSDFTIHSLVTGRKYSNSNQTFTYTAEPTGDTLVVEQTSYMADAACWKTKWDTVIVPDITTPDSLASAIVCRNYGYDFYGEHLIKTGIYEHQMKNRFGCDSLVILDLTVNPISDSTVIDTISSLQLPYVLSGLYKGVPKSEKKGKEEGYATTQHYTVKFSNSYDCDSTVNLQLTVIPQLSATAALLESASGNPFYCADGGPMTLEYLIQHGDFDSLRISFDEVGHRQNLRDTILYHNPYAPITNTQDELIFSYPRTILPNVYPIKVEFFQHPVCGNIVQDLSLDVRYSSAILQQLWSDAIFIRNADNNGGYTFTEYQWYEDGKPIEGETQPYLYRTLDLNHEYCVLLTRASDNVRQFTCAITPVEWTDVEDLPVNADNIPTLFHSGQEFDINLPTDLDARVAIYTPTGVLCASYTNLQGTAHIAVPQAVGCYILLIQYADKPSLSKTIMVIP